MRIIEWAFPYFPSIGGRERFVERITKDLRKRQLDVLLIAQKPIDQPRYQESFPEVDLRIAPAWELADPGSPMRSEQWERLSNAIGNSADSVLHIHRLEGVDVLLIKRIRETWAMPVVMTLHNPLLAPIESSEVDEERFALVDLFVAISPFVMSQTLKVYPNLWDRLTLIPNSVPLGKSSNQPGEGFLFMGRLSQEKGVLQLISAFHFLNQLHPDTKLTIAGDGDQLKLLQNAVSSLGLTKAVVFTGWLEDEALSQYISKCRAVVVPTVNQEPFGLVAAEAMSHGKPLIYAVSGALPWIAEDGVAGLSFAPGDIVALVHQMRQLHLNADLARSLGEAGHQIVQTRFRTEDMIDAYIQAFKGLLNA